MLFSCITAAIVTFPLLISAAVTPARSPFVGTITAPTPGSAFASGDIFPFNYRTFNWCEQDYTEFKVSLVSYEPTFDNVTDADGTLQDALHEFGTFTVANFPIIPAQGTPPPSFLTIPDLTGLVAGTSFDNTQLFLAVSDIFLSCPGHIVEEIGVTSVPVSYNPIA
ncbi:hypothetical protein QCA50_001329 [Cerrena zonata]|uniref:Uncharacterized protein n=1 Tax=Cerrena zonata TaxID=2478898 RepID=A0AAW0GX09_9APHY